MIGGNIVESSIADEEDTAIPMTAPNQRRLHSPKVEKAHKTAINGESIPTMALHEQTSSENQTHNLQKDINVPSYHPSLARQYQNSVSQASKSNNTATNSFAQNFSQFSGGPLAPPHHPLNKSRTSAAVLSQSSLNGSRGGAEQVSIISLSSFTRSTPKFVLPLNHNNLPPSSTSKQNSTGGGSNN